MSGIRFDPEDLQALRDRIAPSGEAPLEPPRAKTERVSLAGGLVQLNVRIPPDIKKRLADLARQRRTSLASVIEQAITALEQASS